MKITSSQISFNAERKYEENNVSKREEEILENRASLSAQIGSKPRRSGLTTQLEIARNRTPINPRLFPAKIDVPKASVNDEIPGDPKLAAMKRMLDALMGKKIKLTDISGFQAGNANTSTGSVSEGSVTTPVLTTPQPNRLQSQSNILQSNSLSLQSNTPEMPTRRIRITEFNSHYESEATQFNALGSVKTESGQYINFKLHLDMQREFYSEKSSQLIGVTNLIDPLVVNFGGEPAVLTDVKFKFDLDSDGKEEDISWLSSGSGFLVFDKNQDGVINNGGEMFGPVTNNGFQELAQLDDDKNGWIDENDTVFEKLAVWSGDSSETAKFKSLKESGIGAIAVASTETEFVLKEQKSQTTLGQIRRTGIYLEENGKAGSIQQLDLAI